jgi:hypothetical protein
LQRGDQFVHGEREPTAQIQRCSGVVQTQGPYSHEGHYRHELSTLLDTIAAGKVDVVLHAQFQAPGTVLGSPDHSERDFMTFWQLVLHLFNFALPALAMALFMPWAGRWVVGPGRASLRRRMGVQALCGLAVLVGGLLLHGQDGKMSTYIALVLVAATAEWLMQRGWTAK